MGESADFRTTLEKLGQKLWKEHKLRPIQSMEMWLDKEYPDVLKEDRVRNFGETFLLIFHFR